MLACPLDRTSRIRFGADHGRPIEKPHAPGIGHRPHLDRRLLRFANVRPPGRCNASSLHRPPRRMPAQQWHRRPTAQCPRPLTHRNPSVSPPLRGGLRGMLVPPEPPQSGGLTETHRPPRRMPAQQWHRRPTGQSSWSLTHCNSSVSPPLRGGLPAPRPDRWPRLYNVRIEVPSPNEVPAGAIRSRQLKLITNQRAALRRRRRLVNIGKPPARTSSAVPGSGVAL
jgi:hypothetical protein